MIVRIAFLVLLFSGIAAFAHPEGEPAPDIGAYDCEHPPEAAIEALPGLLGKTGRLVCMREGQRIVASQEWSWRYSGSFFNTPTVPAYAHADTKTLRPPFYFKKVWEEKLTGDEADRRSEQLSEQIVTYRPGEKISAMTIVKAENNYGHITEIFMPMQSEDKGWAIVCAPECAPEYVIVISKLQEN